VTRTPLSRSKSQRSTCRGMGILCRLAYIVNINSLTR